VGRLGQAGKWSCDRKALTTLQILSKCGSVGLGAVSSLAYGLPLSGGTTYYPYQQSIIPDCGDTDSSAAPSALEDGAYIPLDHRTFLQWMSQWPRTQHESGSASFGISRPLGSPGIAVQLSALVQARPSRAPTVFDQDGLPEFRRQNLRR
jgi:hypothetical protein